MYFGQGAGQMPTATAVMADILEIARERLVGPRRRRRTRWAFRCDRSRTPVSSRWTTWYANTICASWRRDKPGVLGAIASVLGRNGISFASVIQQGRGAETTVPVIMRTHQARERNLKRALAAIRQRRMVEAAPAFIRIEEHL